MKQISFVPTDCCLYNTPGFNTHRVHSSLMKGSFRDTSESSMADRKAVLSTALVNSGEVIPSPAVQHSLCCPFTPTPHCVYLWNEKAGSRSWVSAEQYSSRSMLEICWVVLRFFVFLSSSIGIPHILFSFCFSFILQLGNYTDLF